jgi:hypothetical protein
MHVIVRHLLSNILLAVPLLAQADHSIHKVSGAVVDATGKPVPNARVDHSGTVVFIGPPEVPVEDATDADGRFTIQTSHPAVVIRKRGFTSYRLKIDGDAEVKITLEQLPPPLKCEPAHIPRVKTEQSNDIDYTGSWTYIETKDGTKGFFTGSGPSYSWGAPSNSNVWESTQYSEVMFDSGLVDSRGTMPDGTHWRTRAAFGQSTWYAGVDRTTAELLDRLIDGDCHKE